VQCDGPLVPTVGHELSEHCFAQAMVIVGLEEALDLQERGALNRHSGGYFLTVFGDPVGDDAWSWRFESHHLSVTMTVLGDQVSPPPVFLGANPACVSSRALLNRG
jgi:hypothetical protein